MPNNDPNGLRYNKLPIIILIVFFVIPTVCLIAVTVWLGYGNNSYRSGITAYEQGKPEEAISEFSRAIEMNPLRANAYFMRADAYYVLGKYELAIEDYTFAIEKGYRPITLAYAGRGNAHAALGNYLQADRDYNERMEEMEPGEYYQHLLERAKIYSKVIETHPKLASAYYARGFAGAHSPYLEDDTAIEDLTTALNLGFQPQSQVYVSRGLAWKSMDNNKNALRDLDHAIAIDPGAMDAYYYRSQIALATRDYQQAYFDLKILAEFDPSDADTLNYLCWYGSLLGHAQEVLATCERAVELAPESAYIRDSRGLARALTGDFTGAIQDFQYYLDAGYYAEEKNALREKWISALEQGKDPFDQETLEMLLNNE